MPSKVVQLRMWVIAMNLVNLLFLKCGPKNCLHALEPLIKEPPRKGKQRTLQSLYRDTFPAPHIKSVFTPYYRSWVTILYNQTSYMLRSQSTCSICVLCQYNSKPLRGNGHSRGHKWPFPINTPKNHSTRMHVYQTSHSSREAFPQC